MNDAGTGAQRIKVAIVDDHELVRSGLETILGFFADIELVAQADSGAAAIKLCQQTQPDVVLMDLVMPGMDGVAATEEILRRSPGTKVLALTSFSDRELIERALRVGATGYLLKNVTGDELAAAIRRAYAGTATLAPEAAEVLIHTLIAPDALGANLTARERQVLSLIAEGRTNAEIAARLVVSLSTVKTHVSSVITKLEAPSRTAAAAIAVREHLI